MNIEKNIIELLQRVTALETNLGSLMKLSWAVLIAVALSIGSRLANIIFKKIKK